MNLWRATYWPTPESEKDDPIVAGLMNAIPKLVFSKTLQRAEWNNTRLVKEIIPAEINKLKKQPGKDLIIFGSGMLAAGLARHGLIDKYRMMVNPVVLGNGTPLFKGYERLKLKLLESKAMRSGNVLLVYQPDGK